MGGAGCSPATPGYARAVVRVGLACSVLLLLSCTTVTGEQEQEIVSETEEPEINCDDSETIDCASELLSGQFLCSSLDIDIETQQLRGCNKTGKV